MKDDTSERGINKGLVFWGAVLGLFTGLIGLAIVIFGDKPKRRDRFIGLGAVWAVVIVLVIIGVAASGSGSSKGTTSVVTQNTPKAANTSKPSDTAKPAATTAPPTVGLPSNEAQVGNLLLTVNEVAPYTDDLFPAEAGTHYVAVDVTAKNTGTKTYSLNVLNFHLKDSDKFTAETALTHGPDPKIGASDMVPGQEVRGYIVFKLGDTRTPVELQYQSFTGSATTIPLQ